MAERTLVEKVVRVMTALELAGIPAALGGGLALAYHAEPRATSDADINIFVTVADVDRVMRAMADAGVTTSPSATEEARSREQVRLLMDGTFIDLFFAVHPFHESCQRRAQRRPFDGASLAVLAAEDLVVFKVLFNRAKDWLDIEAILAAQPGFDGAYVLGWLDTMLGAKDSARMRFATLVSSHPHGDLTNGHLSRPLVLWEP